jgi:WD40 repeat protein
MLTQCGRLMCLAALVLFLEHAANSSSPPAETKKTLPQSQTPRTDAFGDPLPPGAIARLGTVRFRSEERSSLLRFSPDGKSLTSVSSDAIRLWDIATGKELRKIKHPPAVDCVALSADGKTLALGVGYQTIHLRNAVTGKELYRSCFDEAQVRLASVVFSPDLKILATRGRKDSVVLIWDIPKDRPPRLLQALEEDTKERRPSAACYPLAFSPDGKYLITTTTDHNLLLWEVASGREVFRCTQGKRHPDVVAFSPDGKNLACADEGKDGNIIRLWSIPTRKELCLLKGCDGIVNSLVFAPDGRHLVSAEHDGPVRYWDVARGKVLWRTGVQRYPLYAFAFSPDGKTLAGGLVSSIVLWDVRTGKELHAQRGHASAVRFLALSEDGNTLASASFRGTIRFWDTRTGKERSPTFPGKFVVLSPDNKVAAVWDHAEELHLREVATGKLLRRFDFRTSLWPAGIASVSVMNSSLGSLSSLITVKAYLTREDLALVGVPLAFSSDGKTLISGDDGRFWFWEVATGRALASYFRPYVDPGRSDLWLDVSVDGKISALVRREKGCGVQGVHSALGRDKAQGTPPLPTFGRPGLCWSVFSGRQGPGTRDHDPTGDRGRDCLPRLEESAHAVGGRKWAGAPPIPLDRG